MSRRYPFRSEICFLAMCSVSSAALGQSTTAGAGNAQAEPPVEEIVVTARKRSERLSDVPLSITAASGEQLAQQRITNSTQLEALIPGFTYQQSNYGVPVFAIRGVGFFDTTLAVSPAVTVYVDQIPLPYLAMTRGAILDLARVEALKGPQGTLFGQNSTGGAINYVAERPTDSFDAGINVSYGRFNAIDAESYISGPLTDTLSARVALRTEQQDEWQKSYTRDDELGRKRFYNGRVLLDWTPSEALRFSLNLNGWVDKSDTQAPQFWGFHPTVPAPFGYPPSYAALANYPLAPDNARAADWDPNGDHQRDDEFRQIALRVDWRLGENIELTSISAFSQLETFVPTDLDGTDFRNINVAIIGDIDSFSQELRLAGDAGDSVRWMLGVNYQDDTADESLLSDLQTTNSALPSPAGIIHWDQYYSVNDQTIETKSVFGSLDTDIGSNLTLQVSARYTDQDRGFRGCIQDGDGNLALALGGPVGGCQTHSPDFLTGLPGEVRAELNEENVSWRAGLSWKPSNDLLTYANVTKGYKAGSFPTLPAPAAVQYTPVTQESVLAYEVGIKSTAFSGLAQWSGAVFYYDYKDKQILGVRQVAPFGDLPALVSIPESKVRGAELEFTLRPIDGLRFNGGVTFVDTEILADPLNPSDIFGTPTTYVGERFPNTPEWQMVAGAEYRFPVGASLEAFFGGSATHRSGSFAVLAETPGFEIDSYTLLDLRVGVGAADGSWQAQLWGRNVTDEYYVNNVTHVVDTNTYFAGMPATYGISLTYRLR